MLILFFYFELNCKIKIFQILEHCAPYSGHKFHKEIWHHRHQWHTPGNFFSYLVKNSVGGFLLYFSLCLLDMGNILLVMDWVHKTWVLEVKWKKRLVRQLFFIFCQIYGIFDDFSKKALHKFEKNMPKVLQK